VNLGEILKLNSISNVKSKGDVDLSQKGKSNKYPYMSIDIAVLILNEPEITVNKIILNRSENRSWLSMAGDENNSRIGIYERANDKYIDIVSAIYLRPNNVERKSDYSLSQKSRDLSNALFGPNQNITEILSDSLDITPSNIECKKNTGNTDFRKILLQILKNDMHSLLVMNSNQIAAYKVSQNGIKGIIAEVDGYGFSDKSKDTKRIVIQIANNNRE